MIFFVRKDVAAQVWDLGVGNVSPVAVTVDPFTKLRCNTCSADATFGVAGAEPGQLNSPHGVRIGLNGNIYVADTRNGRISIFDKAGNPVGQIGSPSLPDPNTAGPNGTLDEPWSVAIGKDGTLYVADTWNHRVQVFNAQGQYINGWGNYEQVAANQPGRADGFWGPRDIALDGVGNVYVADTGNKRIRVYDANGVLIRSIGSAGAGPGLLNEPVGLAIDNAAGRLYVADTWNKRIQVYALTDGSPIVNWKVANWYGPSEDTGNRPYLSLDTTGSRLFVTEPDSGRILVWDVSNLSAAGGEQGLLVFGSKGNPDLGRFQTLGGVAVDQTTLYAVDAGASSRVLQFALDKLPGVKPLEPVQPVAPALSQPGSPSAETPLPTIQEVQPTSNPNNVPTQPAAQSTNAAGGGGPGVVIGPMFPTNTP